MDWLSAFASVPLLDRPIVLQAGIPAGPGAFGDFLQERAGVLFVQRPASGDGARPPFAALGRRLHEFVAGAHGEILVLVHDAAISVAVVGAIIPLLDECPGFLLFLLFGLNEFLNVAMPIAQRVHL